ncbi:MAG: YihA family ribosome biogenesis GTP-binding protein [Saprospiraceae bacterium]|nr:YihA family ribosome biogenesis GTP-binding protein [Saprospiraceae bacterium]
MIIKDADFIASYQKESACPMDKKPEFAFIGRSNVGKSSLINMLCGRKGLAKVSNTPGKTQLLNYFEINKTWYLVDLPGYGYAKVSKNSKAMFEKMIENYLIKRPYLITAFVLIDIRHELQKIDDEFINWLGENEIPFTIIFTKSDKVSKKAALDNVASITKQLLKSWDELPPHFVTSSETKEGREEVLDYISNLVVQYNMLTN